MDLSQLFERYPYIREGVTAAAVIFVNLCALVILIAARRERRFDDRHWAKESKRLMLACGDRIFPLSAAEIVIGRHPSADIRFPDSEISRFHALLTLSNGTWTIWDIGAQNGITVNNRRISGSCPLRAGDAVIIGKRRLTVIRGAKRSV